MNPELLDPMTIEPIFLTLQAEIEAVPQDSLTRLALEPSHAVNPALRLVATLRRPERQNDFRRLSPHWLSTDAADRIERLALSVWYCCFQARQEREQPKKHRRLAEQLFAPARDLRTTMFNVVNYHLRNLPGVDTQLAQLKGGPGYFNLAQDLVDLAGLYRRHADILQSDTRFYDPQHATQAVEFMGRIMLELDETTMKDWTLRARQALHLLYEDWGKVRSAARFIYRGNNPLLAQFPSLSRAVHEVTRKTPRRPETVEESATATVETSVIDFTTGAPRAA